MRDKRSLLNFGVLLIVAVGTASFVLNKGLNAIAEVDRMSNTPLYRAERDLLAEGKTADTTTSSTSLTAGWKIYRNQKYGFEVKYPPEWQFKDFGSTGAGLATTIGFAKSFSNEAEIGGVDPVDITVGRALRTPQENAKTLAPATVTDFKVGGENGVRVTGDFYGTRTDVAANGKYYVIVAAPEFLKIVDGMLSAMQFIK